MLSHVFFHGKSDLIFSAQRKRQNASRTLSSKLANMHTLYEQENLDLANAEICTANQRKGHNAQKYFQYVL